MGVTHPIVLTMPPELAEQLEHPTREIVRARALEVFGNAAKADAWLSEARPIFDDRSPNELIGAGDDADLRRVLEALIAIDYGMYS